MSVTGKAFIITANSTFSILFINADFPNVQQPIVPTLVVVMISYCISCLLLSVYDYGTHAILHCYLVDLDLGSKLSPHYLQVFLDLNLEYAGFDEY